VVGFVVAEPSLEPTQAWRIMIGLRQDSHGTSSSDFGARFQLLWAFPLTPGHHTLVIRCLGNWSDDVELHWESASVSVKRPTDNSVSRGNPLG